MAMQYKDEKVKILKTSTLVLQVNLFSDVECLRGGQGVAGVGVEGVVHVLLQVDHVPQYLSYLDSMWINMF